MIGANDCESTNARCRISALSRACHAQSHTLCFCFCVVFGKKRIQINMLLLFSLAFQRRGHQSNSVKKMKILVLIFNYFCFSIDVEFDVPDVIDLEVTKKKKKIAIIYLVV